MAFPLLFPLLASGGLLLRASPHIFRYLAPKAVTGANRLGQLITKSPVGKFATKNPKFTASMVGGSAIESMMTPEEAHAPSNPYLQNMQNPHGPFMPYTVPRAEMPLGVGNHPPIPEALEDNLQEFKIKVDVPQAQPLAPASQTSPVDTRTGFEKFVESDFYKKLQDLFAGMSAAPSGGSGWDALASGVKHLNEGDKQRGKVNQTVEYLKSKGYSEEEARFIAGNKDALNAFLLQKADGGSDARSKEEMDRLRETIELKNSEAISSNTLHDIERFMNYIEENGRWATGNLADWQAFFKVPEHRDMKSLLDSIKNRIGIDRLETMRRYSRNGASGFGNLTERELDILRSYLGEIDYKLGHKELMFRLKKIHEILGKMKSDVLSLLENGNIAITQESVDKVTLQQRQQGRSDLPLVTSKEQEDALPSGARFVGEDGKTRVKGA
ncbi:hypothetical protein [Bartonella krasnovii]|uniref:hypothetical protein n=1 Tax=Bartonella krasnovii TaxID=2267275 RepID=UPI001F4CCEBC|nr:hypothetical protein [Bartonella krasnovii]UNF37860.1 hypothetical protein MNL11_03805 [Bartonella krasnovii]UNF39645.1 hypothetical protein MNL10_04320 [Bartonella krasnovii]UNF47733.1 hypothetical protein MNL05_03465 [Bartonella krasnovii]UNF49332.1 hypothetical protein MNL04_03230 [Bartonella krasnovii]UNF51189.1 hypothetical protein MNL03_04320 [Bartonella krasnovii]